MSRTRLSRFSINAALVLVSVAVVLVIAEVVLRIPVLFQTSVVSQHEACCEHDELLGWRHVPNRTVVFHQKEYEVTERFNSRGVRGPEYAIQKPQGEYRIVVLGDSFAEGYTVEFEELFSEILKKRLNERYQRPIQVINFGVAGYSTDQELLLFESEVKKYQPDLTILIFHDSDVSFNALKYYGSWQRGYKPVFVLEKVR